MAAKAASRRSRRRRNEHRRKILYGLAAAGLLVTTIAAGILFVTSRPVTLRIAVAAASEDAKVVEAIARVLTRGRSSVQLSSIVVEQGQAEAVLNAGGSDLAIVRSDMLSGDLFAFAILRKSALFIWTAPSQGQKALRAYDWKNISGSKIAFLNGNPADFALLNLVLASEGVAPNKVEIVPIGSMDAAAADRSINFFVAVGPIKGKSVGEGFKSFSRLREPPNFLGLEAAEAIVLREPRIEAAEIPKAAFASGPAIPSEAVSVIAVSHLIVGGKAVSEQASAAFARELFAHRQAILREIPDMASIEKPNTEKDAAIPAHPGVAAYIDGTERTFFERYGDYFWSVILVMSALGSFGAGFRAVFHPDEQENVSALRDRVLDLAAKVRDAGAEDLAPIEKEIEHIVRETLDRYEEGKIEEGALTALGIAIEQFRSAASKR
jgi:hypothetical protein